MIDFPKACVTIHHDARRKSLSRFEISELCMCLLKKLFSTQWTTVVTDKESAIAKGSKQRDPLSSLLFNSVLQFAMEDDLRTYFSRLRSTPHLRTHAHHAPSRIPSCSMFNVPFVPFPSLHSSSSASPSRSIATIPMRTRSRCPTSTSAPATWSEPGRLTDSMPNTQKRPVRSCYRQEPKDLTAVLIF